METALGGLYIVIELVLLLIVLGVIASKFLRTNHREHENYDGFSASDVPRGTVVLDPSEVRVERVLDEGFFLERSREVTQELMESGKLSRMWVVKTIELETKADEQVIVCVRLISSDTAHFSQGEEASIKIIFAQTGGAWKVRAWDWKRCEHGIFLSP